MKKVKRLLVSFAIMMLVLSCDTKVAEASEEFVNGVDVGWLSQLENEGVVWVDENGTETDALQLLKDKGANAVRIRAFVNPSSTFTWTKPSGYDVILGYADTQGVLYTAQRANDLGMKISIVFHYSDHFADPQYQDIPSQWSDATAEELEQYVYDYTYYVMNALKEEGIYPEWVEVGNEISNGLLFPYGSTDNFSQLTAYLNSGYDAVKAVSPNTKVVTHLANGQNYEFYEWFFDNFINTYGGKTDVIGVSYYPYWAGERVVQDLSRTLNSMATKYGKEVMICETGDHQDTPNVTQDLIKKEKAALEAVADGKGIGLFYWEPEANISVTPEGYRLGATEEVSENVLKFTSALDAFDTTIEFLDSNYTFEIFNCGSEKALNVVSGSLENSALIEQYDYDEWNSQKWIFEKIDDTYYKIVNKNSGKVLDIEGLSTSAGASCIQYEYNEGWNQMWEIITDENGKYKIKNRWSGLYLGISDSSTEDGALCVQCASGDSDNTNWYFFATE